MRIAKGFRRKATRLYKAKVFLQEVGKGTKSGDGKIWSAATWRRFVQRDLARVQTNPPPVFIGAFGLSLWILPVDSESRKKGESVPHRHQFPHSYRSHQFKLRSAFCLRQDRRLRFLACGPTCLCREST